MFISGKYNRDLSKGPIVEAFLIHTLDRGHTVMMEDFKTVSKAAFVRWAGPAVMNMRLCKVPLPLTYRSLPSLPSERLCFPRGPCFCFHCLANKATLHFSQRSSGGGGRNKTLCLYDLPTIYFKEGALVFAFVSACACAQRPFVKF